MTIKVRIAIVVTLFLVGYMICLWLLFPPTIPRRLPAMTAQEKAWIEERFRYHGIDSAVCEGEVCYFYRDGRKCRL